MVGCMLYNTPLHAWQSSWSVELPLLLLDACVMRVHARCNGHCTMTVRMGQSDLSIAGQYLAHSPWCRYSRLIIAWEQGQVIHLHSFQIQQVLPYVSDLFTEYQRHADWATECVLWQHLLNLKIHFKNAGELILLPLLSDYYLLTCCACTMNVLNTDQP